MKNCILIVLCLLFGGTLLHGDGGRIRIHQQAGPFVVTLFTSPDPLSTGRADFSVAVERSDAPGLVEDADVTLVLTAPHAPAGEQIIIPATRQSATSRFLKAANIDLPQDGTWRVRVLVSSGNQAAECSTLIEVRPRPAFRTELFWQIVAVPLAIILYLLHRRRTVSKRSVHLTY